MELERIAWSGSSALVASDLQRRLEDEGFDVVSWSDPPQRFYAPHSHDHDESLWVVRGTIVFEIGGRDYPLAAGDRLMLPRGTVHAARAGVDGATYLIGER